MNIFGHFKKIFNSFDFMGNRIKRLRVDTPEKFIDDKHPEIPANPQYREDLEGNTPDEISKQLGKDNDKYNEVDYNRYKDFVANKDYVDKRTTYKSERAYNMESGEINSVKNNPDLDETLAGIPGPEKITIYENGSDIVKEIPKRKPSQFPWMNNVFGKPHEEVLDELLYPRIPYSYKYPKVTDINIRTNELLVECLESNHKTNKFIVMQNVENSISFEIFIDNGDWISPNNAELVFIRKDGSSNSYVGSSGITHVVFNFNEANNNRIEIPDDLVKIEFRQTYQQYAQHYDTWGYPSNPELNQHEIVVDITDEFYKQCYPWNLKTKNKSTDNFIDSFNRIDINSTLDTSILKNIKVVNPIDKNYYLECLIYNKETNQLINTTIINQSEINSEVYNFGFYPYPIYIKFRPIPVTTNEGFVQN